MLVGRTIFACGAESLFVSISKLLFLLFRCRDCGVVRRKRAGICVFYLNRHRDGDSVFRKRNSDKIRRRFLNISWRDLLAFVCYSNFLRFLINLLFHLLLHRQTSPKPGELVGHKNKSHSKAGFSAKWHEKTKLFVLDTECIWHLFDSRKRFLQHPFNELLFNVVQCAECDFRQNFVNSWTNELVYSFGTGISPQENRKIRSVYSYLGCFDHSEVRTLLSPPKMSLLPCRVTWCFAL